MKPDIHPKYHQAKVLCGSCDTDVHGRLARDPSCASTSARNCHPFYTGKQTIVDTAGQVERFQKRLERQVRS